MKATRYAYVCETCGHCKTHQVRTERGLMFCPLCLQERWFLLASVVIERDGVEEWERV